MKFYDKVKITVQAGNWWNWLMTWRRETKMPFGWPSGWDWGKWWDIIIISSKDENTLMKFRYQKIFKSKEWERWMPSEMNWCHAEDVILTVPVWTLVKDAENWKILFQFKNEWEKFLAARWWRWWLWNPHFKSSTRQFPQFALLWEPWETQELLLELQMIWDVALIWTPSVGKSTIINALSNVKAKTADYHFTTIVPNIWVVKKWDFAFNIVDIPWLIDWASQGKWLWNEFLRHILKAQIFCFVLDISRYESWMDEPLDILEEIKIYISQRFENNLDYGKEIQQIDYKSYEENTNIVMDVIADFGDTQEIILKKHFYFIINKYDTVDDAEILEEYKKNLFEKVSKRLKLKKSVLEQNTIALSTFINYWTEELVLSLIDKIKNFETKNIIDFDKFQSDEKEKSYVKEITETEMPYLLDKWYVDENQSQMCKVWEIYDEEVANLVFTLPWWNEEAENWFWEALSKKQVLRNWERIWIYRWDILKIKSIYHWYDDRYVSWD